MSVTVSLWTREEYADELYNILKRISEPDRDHPAVISLVNQLGEQT